jgi:hypothetical protein
MVCINSEVGSFYFFPFRFFFYFIFRMQKVFGDFFITNYRLILQIKIYWFLKNKKKLRTKFNKQNKTTPYTFQFIYCSVPGILAFHILVQNFWFFIEKGEKVIKKY